MKTKFLSVCLGISAVLLSASVFVYSISPAKAAAPISVKAPVLTNSGTDEYPLGITGGYAYWFEYVNGTWSFNKRALDKFNN
ncbi:MAG TPA: hypothetical protein VN922_16800 [Bacteroidia bacterium]|nr:hypothetical protein [Bacteroidia bacterium]